MPAPTFQQEMLVARIRSQWAFDMVRIQPTFATVLRSGGTGLVVVKPDGAAADSEQVIPFLAGTRWTAGQRVITVPTQGGAPVAIGVVPTSASQYAVVGTEHIIPGSITAELLASGAISFRSLDVDTQGRISGAQTTANQALSAAQSASSAATSAANNAANANNRAAALESRMAAVEGVASNAAANASSALTQVGSINSTLSTMSGRITTAITDANTAYTTANGAQNTANAANTQVDNLRTRFNRHGCNSTLTSCAPFHPVAA